MPSPPNLATNHVDGVAEIVHAADINDLAQAVNRDWRLFDVQAFGAVPDSTNGTNGTDSTAAIQACINALGASQGGLVYLSPNRTTPARRYRITAPLTINGSGVRGIVLHGDAGVSGIMGNFSGYLIQRSTNAPGDGPIIIEGLELKNFHAQGSGIQIISGIQPLIRDCTIKVNLIGIDMSLNIFTGNIERVRIEPVSGQTWPVGQIGIVSNAAHMRSIDISGMTTGVVVFGGSVWTGGRIEQCVIGLIVGVEADLVSDHAGGIAMTGVSFESNQTGIYLKHAGTTHISSVSIQGSTPLIGNPALPTQYGLRCQYLSGVTISSFTTNGTFAVSAVQIDAAPVHTIFEAVVATNSGPGVAWALPSDPAGITFTECNNTAADIQTNVIAEGQSLTAPATGAAGTIDTTTGVSRIAPGAARTGVILLAGTVGGQRVTVINQSASANSITFATDATSNVADGLSIVIPGLRSRTFIWNSAVSRWFTA